MATRREPDMPRSTSESLIPTLSLKLNLTLIITHTNYNHDPNPTNPSRTSRMMKLTVCRRIRRQHYPNNTTFSNTLNIWDYTGHQPALGIADLPMPITFRLHIGCLHVGFPPVILKDDGTMRQTTGQHGQ